jgi:hypothetical protein
MHPATHAKEHPGKPAYIMGRTGDAPNGLVAQARFGWHKDSAYLSPRLLAGPRCLSPWWPLCSRWPSAMRE